MLLGNLLVFVPLTLVPLPPPIAMRFWLGCMLHHLWLLAVLLLPLVAVAAVERFLLSPPCLASLLDFSVFLCCIGMLFMYRKQMLWATGSPEGSKVFLCEVAMLSWCKQCLWWGFGWYWLSFGGAFDGFWWGSTWWWSTSLGSTWRVSI